MGFEDEPLEEALSIKLKRSADPKEIEKPGKKGGFSFPRRKSLDADDNPRLEREMK